MTELNLDTLAEIIRERYTPLAFTCDCNGTHPDCADTYADTWAVAQYDTIKRVVSYIQNYNPNL
jgi:hypothetical protein